MFRLCTISAFGSRGFRGLEVRLEGREEWLLLSAAISHRITCLGVIRLGADPLDLGTTKGRRLK